MVDAVWERLLPIGRHRQRDPGRSGRWLLRTIAMLRWAAALSSCFLLAWGAATEARTSYLQSRLLSRWTAEMKFATKPGRSDDIRFPKSGPYDKRLGYAQLPSFIEALHAHQYSVAAQARWSQALEQFVDQGGYTVYGEKTRAGLKLYDGGGDPVYQASYPERAYPDFASIPPLVVASLLFIEDHDVLDLRNRRRNPAIDWGRFMLAVVGRIGSVLDRRFREGGASTLATQIEKFRHSAGGRTPSIRGKFRQMLTASARAYRYGPDTTAARREIVAAYLNSTPLSSRPGYGEIIGLPEALWVWYGTDLAEANRLLASPGDTPVLLRRKGEVYRQLLALLLAGRRPSYYLGGGGAALSALTDSYLRLMAGAGIINPALRDAALAATLRVRDELPAPQSAAFAANKATDRLRAELVSMLHVPDLYTLDRIDLTAYGTIDPTGQRRVTDVLTRLGDRNYVKSLGLVGHNLLGAQDPARINWSVVLYERGADRNYLRISADSLNTPFDINSGAKLILGSTAKLRTLVTYLDIVADLRRNLASLAARDLVSLAARAKDDPITAWAAGYLAKAGDRSLQPMIDAAMHRRYSGSPSQFFTGGGEHVFANFEKWEDHENPTVTEAFGHSINNSFVRIMRDIVLHYTAQSGVEVEKLLSDPDDPNREAYLQRFADQEGRRYLARFWKDYRGLTPDEALDQLARRTRPVARRLAVIYLTARPEAGRAELGAFLAHHLPPNSVDDDQLWDLWRAYGPGRLSLQDRGYIAGIHPLELWLVSYLQEHPGASRGTVVEASETARQEVYGWLFKARRVHAQNTRIRILLEQDAFDRILEDWRRQGYPFGHLVPSYGTAIGSSGDRPDALADLMGIILNDGVRLPSVDVQRLHFAADTPYETDITLNPHPQRVLAPEVARTVRQAVMGVVIEGTATRLRGAYHSADGILLPIGGKTGTGDNRLDHFGRGGRLVSQRVIDRTATFVFFLGDRFFGTITAYVPGAIAGTYHFTSALAVQLLRALEPQLEPLLTAPATTPAPAPISEAMPAMSGLGRSGETSAD